MNNRIAELQTSLGNSLVQAYSSHDWEIITMFYGEVGQLAQASSECTDAQGVPHYESIPDLADDACAALKDACATPEHGTWLSLNVKIVRSTGQLNVTYNYDEKSEWDFDPQPENYLLELERYPRPAREIPAWYPKPENYPNWHEEA
ncbi:hypothetical protein [Arthrobacter sp. NA-172]|uniref:hypothetical protein n=1 Tax=Arthrobacter sp. NA-172 TaxID=3367524 RepID=UPI0037546AE0